MLVDINELRERDEPLDIDQYFTEQELKLRNHILLLEDSVHSRMRVSLSGVQVLVAGNLEAELQVTCSRCLQRFEKRVQKGFELEYWPDPVVETENEEIALSYTDLAIGFYRNDQLDVSAVLSEQIVLEIPMKPVCRENCKGLCDQCGADLNRKDCDCERSSVDPRFAALAELKKRMSK